MVDIENIKQKYCMDDEGSKLFNAEMHGAKKAGVKLDKKDTANYALSTYIQKANQKLGRRIQIYEKSGFRSPNPSFGINWAAIGTVSVPETKAFIQKLQQAIEFIQNAPKASGDKRKPY